MTTESGLNIQTLHHIIHCVLFLSMPFNVWLDGHRTIFILADQSIPPEHHLASLQSAHFMVNDNLMITADNGQDISDLAFLPNELNFTQVSIGETINGVVTLINRHANRSVYLGAISGSVPDVYSSFFEEIIIPPMGNTTFNVVFLPRHRGSIDAKLFIHTSFGVAHYTVNGIGTDCPYRLVPLVGLQAPYNASFSPEIMVYNPHSTPLQIVEVYSSGGQFQLELPGGSAEGPQILWEIAPYCTKTVIRVRFLATIPGNHTAYIRIKVATINEYDQRIETILVVPIEVEILNDYGLYPNIPLLNFGLAGNRDQPKNFIVKLLNSGSEKIDIDSYSIEATAAVKRGVTLNLPPEAVEIDRSVRTLLATIDWSLLSVDRFINGNILIETSRSNDRRTFRLPFTGEILPGSISYNETITKFPAVQPAAKLPKHFQDFILKNNFKIPLAITNVTVPSDTGRYFSIKLQNPRILQPNEQKRLFQIAHIAQPNKRIFTKSIFIHTNVTDYEILAGTYTGSLRRIVPVDESTINGMGIDEKAINFGTIPSSTTFDIILALVNDNPIPISIHNWKGTISGSASIDFILRGCGKLNLNNLKFCHIIKPGEWVVFQISVQSNAIGSFSGKFSVKTDFEELTTPVKVTTAMGRLHFMTIMRDKHSCFPGGICSLNITTHSTFLKTMTVEGLYVDGIADLKYNFKEEFQAIAPNEATNIGQIHFRPSAICNDSCYIQYPDQLQPSTLSITNKLYKQNNLLANRLDMYRQMKIKFQSIKYRIKTNQVRRYDFNGSIDLQWPKLVSETVQFAVTQAGSENVKLITITNPTNDTIAVYYMLHDPFQHGTSFSFPAEIITECRGCSVTRESVFSFIDNNIKGMHLDYIPAKSSVNVAIMFSAPEPGDYSTVLYIRNNFTIMEAVWLTAKNIAPQFKLGNRKPGSPQPLHFTITENDLRDCDRHAMTRSLNYKIYIKRSYTARNVGDVPIFVYGIRVNGRPCQGYGFRVEECTPFELPPNGSRKFDFYYSPDFTVGRSTKLLEFQTTLNYSVNYTLASSVPIELLATCYNALVRPSWEATLKYGTVGVLFIAFICVIFVSYVDASRIIMMRAYIFTRNKMNVQPTLDLREIGVLKRPKSPVKYDPWCMYRAPRNKINVQSTMDSEQINAQKRSKSPVKDDPLISPIACKSICTKRKNDRRKYDNHQEAMKSTVPKKSDVKFRDDLIQPVNVKGCGEKKAVSKKRVDVIEKIKPLDIEDDSSSTTTESSIQSDEGDKKLQTKAVAAPFANVTPPKVKQNVKKTKSLPTYATPTKETNSTDNVLTNSKPTPPKSNQPKNNVLPKDTRMNEPNASPEMSAKRDKINRSPDDNRFNNLSSPKSVDNFNQSYRKYGKTPGRERNKKNDRYRDSTTPRVPTYKGTAFQFGSPISNHLNGTGSAISQPDEVIGNSLLWDTKKVSFSHVVAQNPQPEPQVTLFDSLFVSNGIPSNQINPNDSPLKQFLNNHLNESFNDLTKKSSVQPDVDVNKPLIDLGPIGTRKSPSLTPVWEPLSSIQKPVAVSKGKPINSQDSKVNGKGNGYFLGDPFPLYDTQDFISNTSINSNKQQGDINMLGGASGLLDSLYEQSINRATSEWDTSLLLQMLQQQRLSNLWGNGYENSYNTPTPPQHQQQITSDKLWSTGPVRPPPGLQPKNLQSNTKIQLSGAASIGPLQFDPFNALRTIWSTDTGPTMSFMNHNLAGDGNSTADTTIPDSLSMEQAKSNGGKAQDESGAHNTKG